METSALDKAARSLTEKIRSSEPGVLSALPVESYISSWTDGCCGTMAIWELLSFTYRSQGPIGVMRGIARKSLLRVFAYECFVFNRTPLPMPPIPLDPEIAWALRRTT